MVYYLGAVRELIIEHCFESNYSNLQCTCMLLYMLLQISISRHQNAFAESGYVANKCYRWLKSNNPDILFIFHVKNNKKVYKRSTLSTVGNKIYL